MFPFWSHGLTFTLESFFVELACHQPVLDGFNWHYQASVHLPLPLSKAVNKSLQHRIYFFRENSREKNFWEHGESNPGLLGEKRECHLCAMPPPNSLWNVCRSGKCHRWHLVVWPVQIFLSESWSFKNLMPKKPGFFEPATDRVIDRFCDGRKNPKPVSRSIFVKRVDDQPKRTLKKIFNFLVRS